MSGTLTQSERRRIGQRGWRLAHILFCTQSEHALRKLLLGALHAGRYDEAARCLAMWDAMDAREREQIERLFKWQRSAEQVVTRLSIRDLEERLHDLIERPPYRTERTHERLQRTDLPIYRAEYDRRLAACLPAPQVGTDELTEIERMRLEAVKRRRSITD